MQALALSSYVDQVAAAQKIVDSLSPPTNGEAVQNTLRKLNDAVSATSAAAHDAGLVEIARQFAARSASDGASIRIPSLASNSAVQMGRSPPAPML